MKVPFQQFQTKEIKVLCVHSSEITELAKMAVHHRFLKW
jgi:hypothetical protein